jgi:hypothetical protein
MRYRILRSILIISILAFIINMNSCTKIAESVQGYGLSKNLVKVLASTDSSTIYSFVWLSGDQIIDVAPDTGYKISAMAEFSDSVTNNLVSMLGLSINSRSLNPNSDYSYYFGYSDSSSHLQEGLNLYGTNVKIKTTGSSAADTVTQMIYMPAKIYPYLNPGTSGGGGFVVYQATSSPPNFPIGQIDMASSLTFNWVPDPNNSWGNVEIKIWYSAAMSRFLSDPTLPSQDTALSYTVPDNGTYTISSSDLQRLHRNSLVHVSLGRGSQAQAVLPLSKKRIFYYATASSSSPTITLVCSANWQNIGGLVCQQSNGMNTGYQIQEQQDVSPCSATYGQTQWVVVDYNSTACPVPITIEGSNYKTSPYNIRFTNNSTQAAYTFVMNAGTDSYVILGYIPAGNYTVKFWPQGQPVNCTFNINGQQQTGTGATFPNVSITALSYASVD